MIWVSIILIYISASLWETLLHWKIIHASRKTYNNWRKWGWVFGKLRKGWFSHNFIHHKCTFNPDPYTQFSSVKIQQHLDARLQTSIAQVIRRNKYGLTISSFSEIITFIAPPSLMALIIFYYIYPQYNILLLVFWLLHYQWFLVNIYIHYCIHLK